MTLSPIDDSHLPEIVELLNRGHAVDGPNIRIDVDEFRQELNSSLTSMDRDVRVARDEAGRPLGIVWTVHLPSEDDLQRCCIEGCVDPEVRGRGIGRRLLEWAREHARDLLADAPSGTPRVIRVSRSVSNESARRLHHRSGFTDVRWFEDLKRPLDVLPEITEDDIVESAGVVIDEWPASSLDVLPVKNLAFADHWGSTPTTIEGWHELVEGFGGRPDLSRIARDSTTGEIVAFLLTRRYPADDEVNGERQAWINTLGTLRSHRGRGIATSLIIDALHRYRDHDMTHAMIGVDADNPTGAHRLYRSLGFTDHFRTVTSEIMLS